MPGSKGIGKSVYGRGKREGGFPTGGNRANRVGGGGGKELKLSNIVQ